jgi:large subunit ribosomal protein L10
MRPEKQYLLDEVNAHLEKSDYFIIADYSGITVDDSAVLRKGLATKGAEYHVVKNRILNVALKQREIDGCDEFLTGQTAIVVGGSDPSAACKVIAEFTKKSEKFNWKGGVVGSEVYDANQINQLKDLPSIEVLQAQLLGLLNTPAQKLLGTFNAAQRDLVSVLSQKAEQAA